MTGASRGIGTSIAKALAEYGADYHYQQNHGRAAGVRRKLSRPLAVKQFQGMSQWCP